MNDEENLTLHQKSLKALFHTPLQFYYIKTNEIPNHFTSTFFGCPIEETTETKAKLLGRHGNGGLVLIVIRLLLSYTDIIHSYKHV